MTGRRALLLLFLISSLLTSCSDGIGGYGNKDFGNPPTPESCFCDPYGVETYLEWVWNNYPDITDLRIIGYSEDGRKIYALEISDNPGYAEPEPAVLINGAIHGHEQLSAGVTMKLIKYLVELKTDAEDYYLVENFKLHFIPAVNPDGLAAGERYNDNGVDLNRNFGYNWYEYEPNNGSAAFDQSESAAIRDDFMEQGYTLSLNLHTASYDGSLYENSGIGIYAPWDAIKTDAAGSEALFTEYYLPNYPFIKEIGLEYEKVITEQDKPPYDLYFRYGEGADWYPLYGSMADWALGERGTVSYTIELYGKQYYTTDDDDLLEDAWEVHKPALLKLIRRAEGGSGGRVTDIYGKVLSDAIISLEYTGSLDSRSFEPQIYDKLTGRTDENGYFRLLTGTGDYRISISKEEYQTLEDDISVVESSGSGLTSRDLGYAEAYPEYRMYLTW